LQIQNGDSHLSMLLNELGGVPPQLPRKDNRAISLPLYSRWETRLDDLTAALDITQEEVLFMEAKSTFVLIMRSLPNDTTVTRRPLRLDQVARVAATTKNDSIMVRKGIRGIELLSQLQDLKVLTKDDGFGPLRDEVEQELIHLISAKDKAIDDTRKLQEVFRTIRDHNSYLNQQLDTYKDYLHNVRNQAAGRSSHFNASQDKVKDPKTGKSKAQVIGPYKYTHQQLEKEGVVIRSHVPDNRKANIFFNFVSPLPGTFLISLHYKGMIYDDTEDQEAGDGALSQSPPLPTKDSTILSPPSQTNAVDLMPNYIRKLILFCLGRAKSLLELDLKLDDLLEMEKEMQQELDLEYVTFSVTKVLALLNKKFARKNKW
jgi:Ras GTPase-activating-like protein IQGAP2/3